MIRLVAFEMIGTVLDRCGRGAACTVKNIFKNNYMQHISHDNVVKDLIYSKYHIPHTSINEDFTYALEELRKKEIKDAGVSDVGELSLNSMRARLFETGNAMCLYGTLDEVIESSYYNPSEIVKVGGTLEDLLEAKKKGLWTIGVVSTSPMLTTKQLLPRDFKHNDDLQVIKKAKIDAIRNEFVKIEADSIIYDLKDLDIALGYINGKIIAKNK